LWLSRRQFPAVHRGGRHLPGAGMCC
jgi:hypothetical protein